MSAALGWAARHGAWVVMLGVALGVASPALSAAARPLLSAAIFVFTLGALLKLEPMSLRAELAHPGRAVALVAWSGLGLPLVVIAVLAVVDPPPGLAQGLLLWALVPSSGACAAFAVLLGRPTALALIVAVATTALAPLTLPWLGQALGGVALAATPAATSLRLLGLIGGAWAAAYTMRRWAGGLVRGRPEVMAGVSVLALFVAGMGAMRGMQGVFLAAPWHTLGLLALACAVFALAWAVGAMLFLRCGEDVAWIAGLVGATRTVTLAWVVVGDAMLPTANAFLGAAMVAKYSAPAILKAWHRLGIALRSARAAARAARKTLA